LIECAGTAPEIDALPNTLYFVRSSNQIILTDYDFRDPFFAVCNPMPE
jgi:hypothetical protein